MVSKNKKYNDILLTARDLFWRHGFKRVSVEEICEKSAVSKMTFYKYFPNKIELAKTIIDNVFGESETRFREIMTNDSDIQEKIKQIILLKMEGTNNISQEFLQDFYTGKEPELKAYVEKRVTHTWARLMEDLKNAQKNGVLRKDFDPILLIKVQNKVIELLEDESLMNMYESKQELILQLTRMLLYGIAPYK